MTMWYLLAVGSIVVLLGLGVFFGVSWSLRHVADMELSSGIDGVTAFLRHKLAIHEMDNLARSFVNTRLSCPAVRCFGSDPVMVH
jgi:hypothetical protein